MLFIKDAPGFAGEDLVKTFKGFKSEPDGFFITEAFIRFGDWRVDIVAAQFVHAQLFGFEPEVAVEHAQVFSGDFDERVDNLIRNVVNQVAHGNRAAEAAQGNVFVAPVAHQVLIDLPEDGRVLAVDPIKLLIGFGAQFGVRAAGVGHQFPAGQLFLLAVHLQMKDITVGERVVEHVQGVGAGNVFDVYHLFFSFAERVRLEIADLLQPIAVIAAD